ncbi:MAG: helix-turn-helix transcriptional regulator [Oscillospiraceae bacterium]|nr:helix-turn-helix transcriptional regulator [Oscillospiraceae bacterium]
MYGAACQGYQRRFRFADIRTAALLHTSQTVYSRYERGYQTIPVEHLLILADFYGVSVDYILGRTNIRRMAE